MNKREIILTVFFIFIFTILFPVVFASEPNFIIDTTLPHTNLKEGENGEFKIIIHGTGSCNRTLLGIVTDSDLHITKESIRFSYAQGGNKNYIHLGSLEQSATYFCSNSHIFERNITEGETIIASEIFVEFKEIPIVDYDLHFFRVYGNFTIPFGLSGDDYKFKVIFICDNHQFTDERFFHIKYLLEEYQYLWPILTIVIGILSFKAGSKYKRRKKNKKQEEIIKDIDKPTKKVNSEDISIGKTKESSSPSKI